MSVFPHGVQLSGYSGGSDVEEGLVAYKCTQMLQTD